MRYLILKKLLAEDAFLERVSISATRREMPHSVEVRDLDDEELGDAHHDPANEDVIPSIPFTLVEPVESSEATSDESVWGLDAVGATASPFDGRGVTIAVLDTGIDTSHEAFAGLSFSAGNLMDFVVDERGLAGTASDENGHGTHVAGTIFGRPVNGERIGVAPGVERVLIGKVLGTGPHSGSTEAIYNAIAWALRERADIISMSLGIDFPKAVNKFIMVDGLPPGIAASRALEAYRANVRLFDRLAALVDARGHRGRGALLIAASGNESRRDENPKFTVPVAPPAAADGFVSVGAIANTTDPARPFDIAPFSNTGCLLAGPGVSIVSAQLGGGLVSKDGTSMATPHVAGVAALWTQKLFAQGQRPGGWHTDVQRSLEARARQFPGISRYDGGLGLVQAPTD